MSGAAAFGSIASMYNSLIGAFLGYEAQKATNKANKENVEATNRSNENMAMAANAANREIAAETNAMNYDVAMQNLGFQRELQEYQKALQQKQWEREDTSYQRTAQDMLAAGLNPLDMQGTNGAGEVVSMTPLENTFQAQQAAPAVASRNESFQEANAFSSALQAAGSISSIAEALNRIETGSIQRDELALERDRKYIENQILLNDYGLENEFFHDKSGKPSMIFSEITGSETPFTSSSGWKAKSNQRVKREYEHMVEAGKYDSDTDFERILTSISDWVNNGRGEKEWKKLIETYPILKAFSLGGK